MKKSPRCIAIALVICMLHRFGLGLPAAYENNQVTSGIISVDYDGDDDVDLIYSTERGVLSFFRNNGDATFVPESFVITVPGDGFEIKSNIVADMNRDGVLDLLYVATNSSNFIVEIYSLDIQNGPPFQKFFSLDEICLLPLIDGTCPPGKSWSFVDSTFLGVLDADQDGLLDIIIDVFPTQETPDWNNLQYYVLYTHTLTPFSAQRDSQTFPGAFNFSVPSPQHGGYGSIVDLNADGQTDFVVLNTNHPIVLSDTPGTFTPATNLITDTVFSNGHKDAITFCDLTTNGLFDWVTQDAVALQNTPLAVLQEPIILLTSKLPLAACADFDNDGTIDVMFCEETLLGSNILLTLTPLLADLTNPLALATGLLSRIGTKCLNMGVADFDGDGFMDVVSATTGDVRVVTSPGFDGGKIGNFLDVRVVHGAVDAIGAQVLVFGMDGELLTGLREVNGGSGRGGQDPLLLHIGLPFNPTTPSAPFYFISVREPFKQTNNKKKTNLADKLSSVLYTITPENLTGNKLLLDLDQPSSSCSLLESSETPLPGLFDLFQATKLTDEPGYRLCLKNSSKDWNYGGGELCCSGGLFQNVVEPTFELLLDNVLAPVLVPLLESVVIPDVEWSLRIASMEEQVNGTTFASYVLGSELGVVVSEPIRHIRREGFSTLVDVLAFLLTLNYTVFHEETVLHPYDDDYEFVVAANTFKLAFGYTGYAFDDGKVQAVRIHFEIQLGGKLLEIVDVEEDEEGVTFMVESPTVVAGLGLPRAAVHFFKFGVDAFGKKVPAVIEVIVAAAAVIEIDLVIPSGVVAFRYDPTMEMFYDDDDADGTTTTNGDGDGEGEGKGSGEISPAIIAGLISAVMCMLFLCVVVVMVIASIAFWKRKKRLHRMFRSSTVGSSVGGL